MSGRRAPAKGSAGGDDLLSAVAYLFLGFLCGAVFWHFIGFWSTFHDIVLRGPVRVAAAEHRAAQWGPNCTSLVLDRDSGVTRAEPCAASSPHLAEAFGHKRDRLAERHPVPPPLTVDTSWTVIVKEPASSVPTVVGTTEEAGPAGPH